MRISLPVILLLVYGTRIHAQLPETNKQIARVVEGVSINLRSYFNDLQNYTVTKHEQFFFPRWFGRMTEITDVSEEYYSGRRSLDIRVEENGKKITDAELQSQRIKVGKMLEEDEKSKKVDPKSDKAIGIGSFVVPITRIFKECAFSNPRQENLNNREVLLLDFRPKSEQRYSGDLQVLEHLEGTVWIDLQDLMLIKIVANPTPLPGTGEPVFIQVFTRTPGGRWQRTYSLMNPNAEPKYFKEKVKWIVEYSHYMRFEVAPDGVRTTDLEVGLTPFKSSSTKKQD